MFPDPTTARRLAEARMQDAQREVAAQRLIAQAKRTGARSPRAQSTDWGAIVPRIEAWLRKADLSPVHPAPAREIDCRSGADR